MRKLLVAIFACLLVSGVGTFLALSIGLPIPTTFEWPVGSTNNIVMTPEGLYIVPHRPAGRVQIYDAGMRFIRGWQIDAGGGIFKILPFNAATQQVEIVTARKNLKLVYDIDGNLLSRTSYRPGGYASFPVVGVSLRIPTPFWLMPFTNPMTAWIAGVLGGLGLHFFRRDRIR